MCTKKPQHVTSHVFTKTTHVFAAPHTVCLHVWTPPRRCYIFQVSSKSVQGFLATESGNWAIPITLAIRFYNGRAYYYTSRDGDSVVGWVLSGVSCRCESATTAADAG